MLIDYYKLLVNYFCIYMRIFYFIIMEIWLYEFGVLGVILDGLIMWFLLFSVCVYYKILEVRDIIFDIEEVKCLFFVLL